ncbi:MAG: ShlB/FhaC/HecB family hemolysin secretion/activation protein [Lacunisphaera sp.]|nr:ShlB/FhaC/HecB family hemolysin secretion/activation protein [Lacunisphaera sp.]
MSAQEAPAPAAPVDPGVVLERFEYRYGLAHPELPALEELNRVSVRLSRADGVWRPAADENTGEILTLGQIPAGSRFDKAALQAVAEELVRWYNAQDLYGVWVAFQDLEATGSGLADRRAADDHTARLVIWASQVAEVRTLARGNRFKPQFSVNHRKHRGVIGHSPLKAPATPDQPGSLFRERVLNQYLLNLSQHPGRLVEASIASAGDPGKVVLDYLVNESKSWQIFSQVTNFGTEATGVWRGRVGFQHNQLTNHDDILNVDAISTPDGKTYGSFLSYRIPVFRPARLLARVYGSYGDFLANDVSIATLRFAGRNWLAGVEFTNRLSLPRDWQLVSALGANFAHYGIQSRIIETPLVTGSSNFLIPFFATTLSRESTWWSLSGTVRYDQTVGDFANRNVTDGIPSLGRASADADWSSLRWNLGGTLFLEPLFQGAEQARHLANEVSVRVRGRHLLRGSRLIPHEQEPIGGAFSVRGYPESVLSADEFVMASVEYALHFPRLLAPGAEGRLWRWPFNWRPAKVRQNPDWDLIGRVFCDYAYRQVTPLPLGPGEDAATRVLSLVDRTVSIAGVGGGLELQVKQNFSLRGEVGLALTELRDDSLEADKQIVYPAGEMKFYLSSSFSW